MNIRNWLLSLSVVAVVAVPCIAQQQALIPAGSSNLTPGQYMLTNINTGQALYLVIDQSGRLFAQDPRVLQITVQQGQPGLLQGLTGQPGQPGQPGQVQPQQGGFGGLLKQGLQDVLQGGGGR